MGWRDGKGKQSKVLPVNQARTLALDKRRERNDRFVVTSQLPIDLAQVPEPQCRSV